jgi:hypothetical protein
MYARTFALVIVAALAFASSTPAQEPADLVVVNAVVHSMDPVAPRVEAFAVRDGAIVALGTSRSIRWDAIRRFGSSSRWAHRTSSLSPQGLDPDALKQRRPSFYRSTVLPPAVQSL